MMRKRTKFYIRIPKYLILKLGLVNSLTFPNNIFIYKKLKKFQ